MPTSDDYRQIANRAAQIAIACSAPSVARALLALALTYMALADAVGPPTVEREQQLQEMQKTLLAMETRPAVCASNVRVRA
jgi:hypothetical protein